MAPLWRARVFWTDCQQTANDDAGRTDWREVIGVLVADLCPKNDPRSSWIGAAEFTALGAL
jgi:hypothetical protein